MSRYAEFVKIYRKKGENPPQPVESRLYVDLLAIVACEEYSDDETKIVIGQYSYIVRMPYDKVRSLMDEARVRSY